jgi:hypothetical protein
MYSVGYIFNRVSTPPARVMQIRKIVNEAKTTRKEKNNGSLGKHHELGDI